MGDYLSGFVTALRSLKFEICVLKDWRRGEWTKVYRIDMETSRDVPWDLKVYLPIGWLNDDEVLILESLTSRGDIYLAYDVKRNEANIVDSSVCGSNFHAHTHTNSLVSWQTMQQYPQAFLSGMSS
ncbi:hypothetical protein Acr_22g0006300 [Actinidia rufa]|uniref:Uncharacterized protein n=1 Tax=Actinidia rufa TaxID=165716 RepID=A0A7J0GKE2_9ERIC|nr:hypothetical protein Acr_22g0006300 [Actinidia rufa]